MKFQQFVTVQRSACVIILGNVRYLVRTRFCNRSSPFRGRGYCSHGPAVDVFAPRSESLTAGHARQSGQHTRSGSFNLPIRTGDDFRGF